MAIAKKKEEKQHPWARRLKKMKQYQDDNSKTWDRNLKLIYGGNPTNALPGLESSISDPSNEIAYGWGLINALKAQVYLQNPDPFILSYVPEKKATAQRLTSILAWDLDRMDVKDRFNQLFADVFTMGYGCLIEAVETVREPKGEENEEGEKQEVDLVDQQFITRRVHPGDMLFDPQGKLLDLSDHRYAATCFYPTIASLKDDPTYTSLPENIEEFPEASELTRMRKGQPAPRTKPGQGPYRSEETDPEYKTIAVWEIWDKATRKVYYVTDSGYVLIGEQDWFPWIQIGARVMFPFTIFAFDTHPDGFYPKPLVDMIARQLIEMNQIEGMLREDSLTKWRKYFILDKLVGPDWASKVTDTSAANSLMLVPSDELEAILGVDGMKSLDLNRLIVKGEDVTPPRDLPLRKQLVEADIQAIIGYGPGDRGGIPKVRSAREAVMMFERQNQKTDSYRSAVEKFFEQFNAKHIMFLQQAMQIERYAKISDGKPGYEEFFQYSREDIEGDFVFQVIPGSSGPKTTESKRAAVMQEFQILAPICAQQGLNIRALLEYVAEFMGWKSVDELWFQPKLAAQMLGATIALFSRGQATPEQLLDASAKMVQAELSPAELQQLAKQIQGQQAQGPASTAPAPNSGRGDTNPLGTSAAQI